MTPGFLTVKEVSKLLHFSEKTIRKMAKSGAMPAMKIGTEYRFTESDLNTWIEQQRITT